MSAWYIVGDVFEALATLPDDSVDLVFSSPPFLALRSYLPADHPNKGKEIGSEATPADFLDTLLDVVEACDRVLAPHGSLCFELGDTFAGSGGAGGDYTNENGLREGQPVFRQTHSEAWPLPKSLALLPTLFAASLAYGRNLLRPERTTPRWRIRNVVVWARPNPPVGALGDKFRPATSYLTVACKSDKRWFDLDAVRVPYSEGTLRQYAATADDPMGSQRATKGDGPKEAGEGGWQREQKLTHAGAPPLDYWEIPTQPYSGSHYATFPPALCVKPIKAMCPSKVCRVCGEPSRRITSEQPQATAQEAIAALIEDRRTALGITRAEMVPWFIERYKNADSVTAQVSNWERAKNVPSAADWETLKERLDISDEFDAVVVGERTWTESTIDYVTGDGAVLEDERRGGDSYGRGGHASPNQLHASRAAKDEWTDCNHNDWRAGCVLDPFAGSGTTLAVATGHGRDAIGIDLDQRNAELALERVGPLFLEVETLADTQPFSPPPEDVESDVL